MALPTKLETEILSVSEARRQFSDVLNRVYHDRDRIVVEKNGVPMAAIVTISDFSYIQNREKARQDLREILNRTDSPLENVSDDEIEREVEAAIAEVKAEARLARRIVSAITRATPDAFGASDRFLESTIQDELAAEARRRALESAGSTGE